MTSDENKKIYEQYRNHLLSLQLSNSENYDKAILTLSSAALGISLTIIKDIFPLENIIRYNLLFSSWISFAFSILITLLSYVSSQLGIKKQLLYSEKYYLEDNQEYFNKRNIFNSITSILNRLSGIAFILGVVLIICFVSSNVSNVRRNAMVDKEKSQKIITGKEVDQKGTIKGGAEVPQMLHKISEAAEIPRMYSPSNNSGTKEKGAEVPTMQPAQPANSGNTSQSGNSGNSSSGNSSSSSNGNNTSNDKK